MYGPVKPAAASDLFSAVHHILGCGHDEGLALPPAYSFVAAPQGEAEGIPEMDFSSMAFFASCI